MQDAGVIGTNEHPISPAQAAVRFIRKKSRPGSVYKVFVKGPEENHCFVVSVYGDHIRIWDVNGNPNDMPNDFPTKIFADYLDNRGVTWIPGELEPHSLAYDTGAHHVCWKYSNYIKQFLIGKKPRRV